MTEFVQFNVGGSLHKVSKSLLKLHSNSMLADIASGSVSEIFIERNGSRFQYVLDYMRDGMLVLPITEAKESVLAELRYFEIEVDESTVSDTLAKQTECMNSFTSVVNELGKEMEANRLNFISSRFALQIINLYSQKVNDSPGSSPSNSITLHRKWCNNIEKQQMDELIKGGAEVLTIANAQLHRIGLSLASGIEICNKKSGWCVLVNVFVNGHPSGKKRKRDGKGSDIIKQADI